MKNLTRGFQLGLDVELKRALLQERMNICCLNMFMARLAVES